MQDERSMIQIPKRWLRRAVIAVAVGMLVLPAAAWAGHQFTDVPDSNIFHDDIDWLASEGVTRGCNPPENTKFCPEGNVTREQMAAFLHRMDTEDVFVTPTEADLDSHFAVVKADGTTTAKDNLSSSARNATGDYTLTFAADVSDCSWTGTIGDRGTSPVTTAHSIFLNANDSDPAAVDVVIVDDADARVDAPFNVTITCNR